MPRPSKNHACILLSQKTIYTFHLWIEKLTQMKRLPSLNALRFFESAARLGSFVSAAEELHLTHGAVSRQIRLLEDALGLALFERRNRAVFLTKEGAELCLATQQAFAQLNRAIESLHQPQSLSPLVLSCEPTISMKWLIPRLGDFYRQHPEIQLHLFAAGGAIDFRRSGVDLALRRNDFSWDAELYAEKICDERIGPVCIESLYLTDDFSVQQRLHTATRSGAWNQWDRINNSAVNSSRNQNYEHFYLSLQAACAGLGVAISSFLMVQEELSSKRLIAPHGFIEDGSAYFLLSDVPIHNDARRSAFLRWLRGQITDMPV